MGGLVSSPWLAHRQGMGEVGRWEVLILQCFPITLVGKEEGQQSFPGSIKTQFVEQSRPAELSWRRGNLWINSFIRISRRTVVISEPKFSLCPHGKISGLFIYPSQTRSHPFSPPGKKHGEHLAQSVLLLIMSSAQLTTELETTSRGRSSHREGPSETCQTLYVTSITILTRHSSTGYMSS